MKKIEQGITLIELLATIALLSILGILIWSVFFQGYRYSKESISTSQLQQEANRISTELMNFHRNTEFEYTIRSTSCEIHIYQDGHEEIKFASRMCLSIHDEKNATTIPVDPDRENKKLFLSVANKKNVENKVEIEIFLHRLKSGE